MRRGRSWVRSLPVSALVPAVRLLELEQSLGEIGGAQ